MRPRKKFRIYQSRTHLLVTLFFIALPFLFFLLFSNLSHIATGRLFEDIFISITRLVVAYFIAVFLGWICAVSFFRGKRAIIALPIFDVLQSFPTFAALPLASYFLGVSNTTVIIFLVVTIIWPIFFSIISSLKLLQRDWEEAVEISGLSGWNYISRFLWPASITGLITGSIIGLGEGWEALVATEIIVGIKSGLGSFFDQFSKNAWVTAFGILGLLLIIFSINKLVWIPLLEMSHKRMEE